MPGIAQANLLENADGPLVTSLAGLREAIHACRRCPLYRNATQAVPGEGPRHSRLMLVGEQPGDKEDLEGEPFVGPAGTVLAEALAAAGVDPGHVYLTNAVKHFRFEERGKQRLHKTPDLAHIRACHPWLTAELKAVRPVVVVCLGATAGRAVLGRPVRIGAERGRLLSAPAGAALGGTAGNARVLLTTHPSAVLRLRGRTEYPEAFDLLVADLEIAAAALGGGSAG